MGQAIDTRAGFVTNQTGLTTVTASPPDANFVVPGVDLASEKPVLAAVWGKQATNGAARIISPALHDFVNGLRFATLGTVPRNVLPEEQEQVLYPQDPLTVQLTSGGADSSVIVLQTFFENLAGISANLYTWDEVDAQVDYALGVLVSPTGSGTIGTWGPGRAINADADQFKVNRWYAVLGAITDAAVAAIALRGTDTGNLRIGMPGTVEDIETRSWFARQSRLHSRPYIPVFNSANRAGVLVDLVSNTASPAPNITFNLALLKGSAGSGA